MTLTLTNTKTNLVRTFLVFSDTKNGGPEGIADYLWRWVCALGHAIEPAFPS